MRRGARRWELGTSCCRPNSCLGSCTRRYEKREQRGCCRPAWHPSLDDMRTGTRMWYCRLAWGSVCTPASVNSVTEAASHLRLSLLMSSGAGSQAGQHHHPCVSLVMSSGAGFQAGRRHHLHFPLLMSCGAGCQAGRQQLVPLTAPVTAVTDGARLWRLVQLSGA